MLTDGANNVGEIPPIKAAEFASVDEIKIYTIGVGAEEMRVPSLFGSLAGRTTNPSADLDEETLSKIAEAIFKLSKSNFRRCRRYNDRIAFFRYRRESW